jgi:arginine/lysine/ornithine decarboxylase
LNLIEYIQNATKGVVSMHMTGHKRRTGLAPYLEELAAHIDVTEIPGLDDLHCAEGILKQGMEKTAALWGSRRAFWLVNGSTCGILASLYACVPPRGKVICARNCHRSVYNGLGLLDAMPVYIMPEFDTETGISGPVSVQSVEILLDKNPDAALVVVTSPTYEGVISDIEGICAAAHRRGIPLLVDEAHGAHLGFGSGFPGGARRGRYRRAQLPQDSSEPHANGSAAYQRGYC